MGSSSAEAENKSLVAVLTEKNQDEELIQALNKVVHVVEADTASALEAHSGKEPDLFILDRDGLEEEVERRVRARVREMERENEDALIRLAQATELRDHESGLHIKRVQSYTTFLAERAGMDDRQAALIGLASTMHDIGQFTVPESILLKPGELDSAEWELIKSHPEVGAQNLDQGRTELLDLARTIALTHHERWDGTGYPAGLKADEIPLPGRIVCLVDAFDALLTDRPYKEALPVEQVVEVIKTGRGSQFDPQLTDLLIEGLPEVLCLRERYSAEGEVPFLADLALND